MQITSVPAVVTWALAGPFHPRRPVSNPWLGGVYIKQHNEAIIHDSIKPALGTTLSAPRPASLFIWELVAQAKGVILHRRSKLLSNFRILGLFTTLAWNWCSFDVDRVSWCNVKQQPFTLEIRCYWWWSVGELLVFVSWSQISLVWWFMWWRTLVNSFVPVVRFVLWHCTVMDVKTSSDWFTWLPLLNSRFSLSFEVSWRPCSTVRFFVLFWFIRRNHNKSADVGQAFLLFNDSDSPVIWFS